MALGALTEVTIAALDPERSAAFYTECFDWTASESADGSIVVGVPRSPTGRIRLVAAGVDSAPVPCPWDLGARMVSIYSRDVPASAARLEQFGAEIGPIIEYEPFEGRFYREFIAVVPDGVTIVFPHPGQPLPSPALEGDKGRLHGEVHNVCLTVEDLGAASRFYVDAGQLEVIFGGEIDQPEIRTMMSMPEASTCSIELLADRERRPARLELLSFTGVQAADVRDCPTGIVRIAFDSDDPESTRAALLAQGGTATDDGVVPGPGGLDVEIVSG